MAEQQQAEPAAKDNAAESVPILDPDGRRNSWDAEEMLELGPSVSLALGNDALRVLDKTPKKVARTCCATFTAQAQSPRSILYYNILWASLSDDSQTLIIDYAEYVSKTRLQPAKLCLPVAHHIAADSAPLQAWIETLLSRSYAGATRAKRAYVLVNPFAGPGGAIKTWERQVRPLFEAARMPLTEVRTRYAGEAVDLVQRLDVDAFDIVVACSGDGLPHEVFNGLGRRPDARRALGQLAVCHIPCGSGNAMSCNLYGTHRPTLAALTIIKGLPTPLDLVSITQGERRTLSFLSQALGIVADLDLGTEHMRWMGSHRFTVGFLQLVLKKKVYPCDIAVKVQIEHKARVKEHYRRMVSESGFDSGMPTRVAAKDDDASGSSDGGRSVSGQSDAAGPGTDDKQGLPPLRYRTVLDKLPEGWELIPHEKLTNFYCGNMAYMSPDANFFSAALANDGLMDLIMIDGDVAPLRSIKLQLSLESGHFFDDPLVSYRKVSAYRIIPHDAGSDGYISIDGERVPFEPFQAEVHRSLGLTLSKRGVFEAPGPKNWDSVTTSERLLA